MLNFAKQTPIYAKVWQNAGLDFLYIQDKERLKALNMRTKVQPSVINNAQKHHFAGQNAQNRQNSLKQNFMQNKQSQNSLAQNSLNTKIIQEDSSFAKNILKQSQWPELWHTIWQKVGRESIKIAWTYTGLYNDLFIEEAKNPQRQEVIRSLIRKLKRQGGTHSFIPYDCPNKAGEILLHNEISFYWSALTRLQTGHLFVFGTKAQEQLHFPQKALHSSFPFMGYQVHFLPELESLKNEAEQDALISYLSEQLASFNI